MTPEPTATAAPRVPPESEQLRVIRLRRELATLDRCWCGEAKGHIGWLICLDLALARDEEGRSR